MDNALTTQPEELADGGLVGKFAHALSERMFGKPPAPPPAAPGATPAPASPASAPVRAPGGAIGDALRRREAAAGLADGGPVVPENGIIEGPGTGTSDSIAADIPTGSYVVPADTTQALVSNGEATISPEVMQAAMAAAMDVIKAALHTPADQQPQSAAAPAEPPAFADGGLVDEDQARQQRVAQIPTAAPTAPAADGSQSNIFTNNEVGRNLSNAAAALPGIAPMRVAAGAGRAATAGGALATAERVHPAAWEVVEGSGPLARAAQAAPRSLLSRPAGPLAAAPETANSARSALLPGGARGTLSTISDGARTLGARAVPSLPQTAQTALSTSGAGVRGATNLAPQVTGRSSDAAQAGAGLARPAAATAAAGAGLGAAALLGGDSSVASPAPAPQSFSDARFELARGNYADSRVRPAAEPSPNPGNVQVMGTLSNNIVRQGNSYSSGDGGAITAGATINGREVNGVTVLPSARDVLSRPGGISAQNEMAAQNLSDRNARESLGRVMAEQMRNAPAAAPATPFVASGGSFGFRRDPNIVASEQASIADFNRARGTDPRSLANAAAERLAGQKSQAEMAQTQTQEQGAMDRELVRERGLGMRAMAQARASGNPPSGYRWSANGSSLEAIPGGPTDIKAGELGAKAEARQQSQAAQAANVRETIKDARGLVGWNTAGVGGTLARVPATDARNLQTKLETIKANLGFDRLQQMRDESPTGGALGAVAVQELTALQSTVASLDQLQSPKELASGLKKIDDHYTRWESAVQKSRGGAPAPAPGADGGGQLAELRRRAASDPQVAERLRAAGY